MNGELPRSFKLATIWLLIGVAVFLAVQWALARQRATQFSALGDSVELRRGPDGHFHWPGRLNGVAVDFLVDTGATSTAVPAALARRAGLRGEGALRSSTAGGMVDGVVARADIELEGGVRVRGLRVAVLPELGAPLLGMDLLSRMHFSQQGGVLRLSPAPR